MMMYGDRVAHLRKDVLDYIKRELSRKEYEIGTKEDILEDEEDNSLYYPYLDDFDYTEYRLLKAYKDDGNYYVRGFAHKDTGDEMDFELDDFPVDLLCDMADAIFTEPLKYLPDDFRGTN
jgi:hypothetical protein